jgi:hypothetical protein
MVKVTFADSGSKADVLANLEAARAWVLEQNEENLATARAYLDGRSAFPERAALNQLGGRFLTDFYVTVARWVDWASAVVAEWPDDVRDAPFSLEAAEEGVRLSASIPELLDGMATQESRERQARRTSRTTPAPSRRRR